MFQPPSSDSDDYYHDVILFFRSQDTHSEFTDLLYHFLTILGEKVFKGYDGIQSAETIEDSTSNAIRKSRIAIIVFTGNYANSTFCLDGLALIFERYKQEKMKLFPVFYQIDPSVVRYQRESYGTAFEMHKQNFGLPRLHQWEEALHGVTDFPGWHYKKREEELDLIKQITTKVSSELRTWSLNGKGTVPRRSKALNTTPLRALQINSQIKVRSVHRIGIHEMEVAGDDEFHFDSTTWKELVEGLEDDKRNIIGLYGEQGSGKTTLVEAVRDKVKTLKVFDAVLFATVSQKPDEWGIQSQIAKCLEIKFKNELGLFGRAKEISMTLKSKKRILIILDDVPEGFDPEKCIGISCDDPRCKFLLTTRRYQDCSLMMGKKVFDCKTRIPMGPLIQEDGLRVSQQQVANEIASELPKYSKVANEIASECERFPRPTIAIGRSLKGKSGEEWEERLSTLGPLARGSQNFLNLRGRDVPKPFTGTLNHQLKRKRIQRHSSIASMIN